MYLNVDFEGLYAAVRRMGADSVAPDLVVRRGMAKIDPIDIQLEEGIQVNLSEVGVTFARHPAGLGPVALPPADHDGWPLCSGSSVGQRADRRVRARPLGHAPSRALHRPWRPWLHLPLPCRPSAPCSPRRVSGASLTCDRDS